MNLVINGEDQSMKEAATVAGLLETLGYDPRAVAVAVNTEFVPRSTYAITELNDGDAVEVVAPMQGG